jgi:DNA-binding transcriptional regulator YiaG
MSTPNPGPPTPRVTQRDLEVRSSASPALIGRFAVTGMVLSGLVTGVATRSPTEHRLVISAEAQRTDNGSVIAEDGWFSWDATYGTTSPVVARSSSLVQDDDSPESSVARKNNTPADLVRMLRDLSGLTWDQLARLFGVSRRALHLWASGGRMNAANQEQLTRLITLIHALPGDTPQQRRSALLAPGSDGISLFDELRAAYGSSDQDVAGAPWSPGDLLG